MYSFNKNMSKKFKPEKYHDTYAKELKDIINAKLKGKKISTKPSSQTINTSAKVIDMMTLLKKSLNQGRSKSKKTK